MATDRKAASKTPTKSSAAGATPAAAGPMKRGEWWLVIQGHGYKVVQSSTRPSDEHEEGENLIRMQGPYHSQEMAEEKGRGLTFAVPGE